MHRETPTYSEAFRLAFDEIAGEMGIGKPDWEPPIAALPETAGGIHTSVGITGDLVGHIRLAFSNESGKATAEAMLGYAIPEMDELALSALAELLNMVAGYARTQMCLDGLVAEITPPEIWTGLGTARWPGVQACVMPLRLPGGLAHLTVALRDGRAKEA